MLQYSLSIRPDSRRSMRSLPSKDIAAINSSILALVDEPRPSGCKKLHGKYSGVWRIRVGRYRILYLIDDTSRTLDVIAVDPRKDAYD